MAKTDTTSPFIDALMHAETPSFALSQLEGFPWGEYSRLIKKYTEDEDWYTGKALESTKQRDGKEAEIYPIRINPIKSAVQKHAFALFGEVDEDDQPLVGPKVIFSNDEQQKLAEEAEDILKQVWWESSGRALQWQNGAISQVYGGCVFKASYDAFDMLRTYPIRIENPHPKYFIGKPDSADLFRLREAWFVKPITMDEAIENGFVPSSTAWEVDTPWLIEHWTDRIYDAWVNEQPVRRTLATGDRAPVSGANPWGFVPAMYIPHIRVDGFYGENLFDPTKGVIKELNLRLADFGDAVNVDAHSYLAMKDVAGSPTPQRLAPSLYAINLGNTPSMVGGERSPDLWEVRKASASEAMATLYGLLYDQFRRDAFVPKVADGEDEGSQRSGLTLAMRMLSLLWHIHIERIFWTAGLNMFNRMILRMLAIRESEKSGITIRHASLRIKQDWSPILPRDREMLINEVVARAGAKVSSLETLFGLLGDIQDPEQEIKDILEFQKQLAKATSSGKPQTPAKPKQAAPGTPTNTQAEAATSETETESE